MSFSATVDSRYRLIAADLGERPRTVMVTRVSYQGVENLQPMLHFEGIQKPLALDTEQRLVVNQIARSTAVSDWVGLIIELHPVEQDGRAWIEITPVGGKRQKAKTTPSPSQTRRATAPQPKPVEAVRTVKETKSAPATKPTQPWFDANDLPQTSIWTPILLGFLLILAFVAVFQMETNAAAWQWVANWLNF